MFGFFDGNEEEHEEKREHAEHAAHAESWLGRAAHLLHGAEEEKLLGGAGVGHGWGKALPFLGALHGAASSGINATLAVDDFQRDGEHSDEGYKHLGGAYLGAASAALSWSPYGEVLAAGEVATDVIGHQAGEMFGEEAGFNADDVAGGWIRGTVGDKSTGYKVGTGVSEALGGGWLGNTAGVLSGIGAGMIAMPFDQMATINRGVWNEVEAIGDGIANGEGTVGKPLHDAGSAVATGHDALTDTLAGVEDTQGTRGAPSTFGSMGETELTINAIFNPGMNDQARRAVLDRREDAIVNLFGGMF